jgi:hypothetical protein
MQIRAMTYPIILQIIFTAFMCVYIPAYTINYGWRNFLWFSNLMLFETYIGIMTGSRLLVSMAAVGGLFFETIWSLLYLLQLFFKIRLNGFHNYMFDPQIPLWLRSLSLFHLALPPIWLWLLIVYGYNPNAGILQVVFFWLAIIATWLLTDPEGAHVNWIFEYQKNPRLKMGVFPYLALGAFLIVVILGITHFIFLNYFQR